MPGSPEMVALAPPVAVTAGPRDQSLHLIRKMRDILLCFLPDNDGQTLASVHRLTGLPTSTALRILRSLVSEEFLIYDGERYRLSKSMVRWAVAIGDEGLTLRQLCAPHLVQLSLDLGYPAVLYVEDGDSAVCVSAASRGVTSNRFIGSSLPLVGSPVGKLMLAYQHDGVHRLMRSLSMGTENLGQRVEYMRRLAGDLQRIRHHRSVVQRFRRTGDDWWVCSAVLENETLRGAIAVRMPADQSQSYDDLAEQVRLVGDAAAAASSDLSDARTAGDPMLAGAER